MAKERVGALILQPLDAVVGSEHLGVHRVAVGQEDVLVAVTIQIDKLNPGRTKGRVRCGVDDLGTEPMVARVEKRHDRLVLLAQEGHEVGPAVAIEVGHRHVNRAVAWVDRRGNEDRPAGVGRTVFQQEDPPGFQPSELGNNQVEIPVAVEVRGLGVGDAAKPAGQSDRRERSVGHPLEPDDTPDAIVGRRWAPQVGDDEILDPVTVQVDDLGMRRMWNGIRHDPQLRLQARTVSAVRPVRSPYRTPTRRVFARPKGARTGRWPHPATAAARDGR